MSSQRKSSKLMQEGARIAATELIREPVKQAVREALHEEATSVSSTGTGSAESQAATQTGTQQSKGGPSRGAILGALAAIAGVAYLARRRMSSTTGSAWSEPSAGEVAQDDAEGGYVSEGEMQTSEASDET